VLYDAYEGQFRREPQGCNSLDFPIYAVYWYGKRQFGYCDYVSGGSGVGGAIEGVGCRLEGECVVWRFDGGNFSMATPNVSHSNPGCAGGGR
jgi:hypothetical protein